MQWKQKLIKQPMTKKKMLCGKYNRGIQVLTVRPINSLTAKSMYHVKMLNRSEDHRRLFVLYLCALIFR